MQWKLLVSLFVFLCAANVGSVHARETYDSILQRAEAARSSDPLLFTELLEQLRVDKRQTTLSQRQRLKYLQAYGSMYRDQLGQGVELAKQLFNETKDPNLKYRAGGLVAAFSAVSRDFSTGLRYLQKAESIREQVDDKSILREGLGAGALLYSEIGQHRIALRYSQQLLNDAPTPRERCFAGQYQVISQFELQELPKDDAVVEAVIAHCSKLKEHIPANIARGILARKLAGEGKIDKAIAVLEAALPEVKATRYPRLVAGFHALLADFKLKLGDIPAAEAHALATVAIGDKIKSSTSLVSAYNTLYKIAAAREKPSVALELYKRYAESEMAHQNDVKAKELAYEIVRHETKQQAQQLALERASTQKARLVAGFLLVMLGAIVFWMINIKRHQGQLQRLAQTDALTGLGNRHFFTQTSERALVEAARAGDSAALVMFDLDHFKAINDTYGHGAGDWVLKQVGKTCNAHCRKIDYIGRIGGEEFAVLLHGFDLASAARMAEDCRSQLAQIDTRECGYSFVVTASFGVSSTALSGYDLSRLLSHADQMLYRAKNEGRNRVCAYTAEAAVDHKSPKRSPTLTVINN